MNPLFAWMLSPWEIIVIMVIGVLLFGRKLPEIGRYMGKSITEFKKGVKGLEDEMDVNTSLQRSEQQSAPEQQIKAPQRVGTTAPKFEDSPAEEAITAPPRS